MRIDYGERVRRFAFILVLAAVPAMLGPARAAAVKPLGMSVYVTAGDTLRFLSIPADREAVARRLEPLRVSRLFVEGRRGGEAVPLDLLREIRDDFAARGVECAGGIATVPGGSFGVRQNEGLGWLNWESPKTQRDVARFFQDNAQVFDTLIVDDFFCTGDTSEVSIAARGDQTWANYRRDLMVSLINPLIRRPARKADEDVELILKFPQWYDRFHLFGYDPPRMIPYFDQIWVGTEVRNPHTRRMGYVQPTEGFMNFRWLASIGGKKVQGAWFDHIECSADQFVDQAVQSVLAGASELTLFHLGDIMGDHPGDDLLAHVLSHLMKLSENVRTQAAPKGLGFYKPPGSDGDSNLYLADYLGMLGLPVLPSADFPESASVVFLPVQAGADKKLVQRVDRFLAKGGRVVMTPALVRTLGADGERLSGIGVPPESRPIHANAAVLSTKPQLVLDPPLAVLAGLTVREGEAVIEVQAGETRIPFLTSRKVGNGTVMLLNLHSFTEPDFRAANEWLLAPLPLGLTKIPDLLANAMRSQFLGPFGVDFRGPPGVALHLFSQGRCLHNFHDSLIEVLLNGRSHSLPSHNWLWINDSGQ